MPPDLQIPPEGPLLDTEREWIANEPPNLLTDAQDTVWGQLRRTLATPLQQIDDLLLTIWRNMFPQTADTYLHLWEQLVDLPQKPAGKSVAQRQVAVLARLRRGAFTRKKRDTIINDFIRVSVEGEPIRFSPEGVPFPVGGIPFYADHADLTDRFQVYEWVEYFYYRVMIGSGYIADTVGLVRELKRMTPAGITFEVDDTRVLPLSMFWLMRHLDPMGLWPLTETSGTTAHDWMLNSEDDSEFSPGAYVGGPTLDNRQLALSEPQKSPLFDGTNDRVEIAHTSRLDIHSFHAYTIVAVVYPTNVTGTRAILTKQYDAPGFYVVDGHLRLDISNHFVVSTSDDPVVVTNQVQLIGVSKTGVNQQPKLWYNGAQVSGDFTEHDDAVNTSPVMLGAYDDGLTWNFVGNMGWVALFDRELTDDEWALLQKARLNTWP